jgi:hypothetical protein
MMPAADDKVIPHGASVTIQQGAIAFAAIAGGTKHQLIGAGSVTAQTVSDVLGTGATVISIHD